MNYASIKPIDIANGEGVRVSLFVSGCLHHCKGCFNSETWDFAYGKPFDDSVISEILKRLEPSFVSGLTLLGGEPFVPSNQVALLPLIRKVREQFPDKTIWAFSGYVYEADMRSFGRAYCDATDEILSSINVLVDGAYVESLKDISLQFRGSSNQRLIDMKQTLLTGEVVLWDGTSNDARKINDTKRLPNLSCV